MWKKLWHLKEKRRELIFFVTKWGASSNHGLATRFVLLFATEQKQRDGNSRVFSFNLEGKISGYNIFGKIYDFHNSLGVGSKRVKSELTLNHLGDTIPSYNCTRFNKRFLDVQCQIVNP